MWFLEHRHGNGQPPKVYGLTCIYIYDIHYAYYISYSPWLFKNAIASRSVFLNKKHLLRFTEFSLKIWHGPRTTKMKCLLQLCLTPWMVQETWGWQGNMLTRIPERWWRYLWDVSPLQGGFHHPTKHWNWEKEIWYDSVLGGVMPHTWC